MEQDILVNIIFFIVTNYNTKQAGTKRKGVK